MTEQDKLAAISCVEELGPCGVRTVKTTLSFDDQIETKELLESLVSEGRLAKKSNGQYIAAGAKKTTAAPERRVTTPDYITNATTDELIKMANDGKLARAEVKRRIKNI